MMFHPCCTKPERKCQIQNHLKIIYTQSKRNGETFMSVIFTFTLADFTLSFWGTKKKIILDVSSESYHASNNRQVKNESLPSNKYGYGNPVWFVKDTNIC